MGIEEVEKGVAMLTAPEPAPAPVPQSGTGPAPKPAEAEPEWSRDPRYQELVKQSAERETALRAWQELAEAYQAKSVEELKPQLDDVQAMYAILEGRADPRPMLEFIQQQHPQLFQKIVAQVTAPGRDPGMVGSSGAGIGPDASGRDPLEEKVGRLEQAWQSREEQAERQRVFAAFAGKVKELGKVEKLEDDEIEDYATRIAAKIGGDPTVIGRIAKGNFADVQRIFTEVHNRELARLKRRLDSQAAAKTKRNEELPKVPAGGAPPAPAEPPKRSLKTWEERTAAARQEWDSQA